MAELAKEISDKLAEPFSADDIDFLPKGQFEKEGKTFITGFPFADPRVYQNRLDAVVPGQWSSRIVSIVQAGNKVITAVEVTICGVSYTDVGESFLIEVIKGKQTGREEENTATESWSQAFKRACSQARLGRYLYDLDKAFLPFDKTKNRITLSAKEIADEVGKLYAKAHIKVAQPSRQTAPAPSTESTPPRSLTLRETTSEPTVQARAQERPAQPTPIANEAKPAESTPQRPQEHPVRPARPLRSTGLQGSFHTSTPVANEAKPAESTPQPEITKSHSQVRPQEAKPQQARPVYYEVFQLGKKQGAWQGIKAFCEYASKELGINVTPENAANLAKPRMDQLMASLTGKDPAVAKQPVTAGK